jgi:uncharacterized protein
MIVRLLIDGNNLLHASDVFPSGNDRSTAAALQALVEVLVAGMTAAELSQTVIVCDGPGVTVDAQTGLQVLHPRRGHDADEILEAQIEAATEPTRLVVVSSDHRVQRAARRVGATAIDSEVYWRQWKERGRQHTAANEEKPANPESSEVQEWLERFGKDGD